MNVCDVNFLPGSQEKALILTKGEQVVHAFVCLIKLLHKVKEICAPIYQIAVGADMKAFLIFLFQDLIQGQKAFFVLQQRFLFCQQNSLKIFHCQPAHILQRPPGLETGAGQLCRRPGGEYHYAALRDALQGAIDDVRDKFYNFYFHNDSL